MPSDDEQTVVRPIAPTGRLGHILPVGTRLRDFEITGLIGEGGFGIVYLAEDRSLQRRVALKEYMPSSMAARVAGGIAVALRSERHREAFAAGLRSFVNEARLLARFDHPSLVKVYRFWEEHGTAYMVMPFYEGETLRAVLAAGSEPPDEATLRSWLRPLLDALDVMHAARCYHRDIAPDNILLTSSGPLLLDFGAARRVIGDMTHALTVVLKPGYAPIEQYGEMAEMAQGPWTDFYALASVVRFAITGRVPPSSVERLLDDRLEPLAVCAAGRYSPRFLAAIDAALAVRPQDRPQTDAEFRALLDEPRAHAGPLGGSFGPVSRPVPLDDASNPRSPAGDTARGGEAPGDSAVAHASNRHAPPRRGDPGVASPKPMPAGAATRPPATASNASHRTVTRIALFGAALALVATAAYLWSGTGGDAATSAARREATTSPPGTATPVDAPANAAAPVADGAVRAATPPMIDGTAPTATQPVTRAAAVTREPPAAAAALPPAPDPPTVPAPHAAIEPPAAAPAAPAAPAARRGADRVDAARRTARAESVKPTPATEGSAARCSDILQKASLEPLSAAEVAYLKRECR